MPKYDSQRQKGFTIIEVLIVLAVAGLIMMIVFQAIPTLQRNSRNSQRKQDVSTILEAVSHYALNNSGAMPDGCGDVADADECGEGDGPLANVRLAYYQDPAAGTDQSIMIKTLSAGEDVANPNGLDKVAVYNFQHCDVDNPGDSVSTAAGFRDIVALYSTESGGGTPTNQCMEL